ncbi:MAG: pyridoxamine 5'-phosphate oxidase family protein [Verrucomicrobia bacterium]|nr:pyridoxamine 5'-phosphate oxidase family protein [Verrucomicrobiota bacterium]
MRYSKVRYGTRLRGRQPLTPEKLDEFLAEPRNCVLGTTNSDGSSQLTPVGFLWDGTAFYVIADKARHWVKNNLRRDPRLSVVVDQGDDYRAVVAKGRAEIRDESIWDMTGKILVKYFGEESAATLLDDLKRDQNQNPVLVVMKPDQLQSWARADAE